MMVMMLLLQPTMQTLCTTTAGEQCIRLDTRFGAKS